MNNIDWSNFGGFMVCLCFLIVISKLSYEALIGKPKRDMKKADKEFEKKMLYQAINFQETKATVNRMWNDKYSEAKINHLKEIRKKLALSWDEK